MNNENKKYFINDVDAEDLTLEEKKPSTSKVLYEDTSKRGNNTKHFRLQNGNFMAVVYDHPVHKLDPDTGKYVDIVSEVQETDTDYETVMEHFKVRTPKNEGKERFVTVEKDGKEVSWKFVPSGTFRRKKSVAELSRRPKQDSWESGNQISVKYERVDTGIDLVYDISDDGVKESIILAKNPSHTMFTFQMNFKGLVPVLSEDKKTVLLLPEGDKFASEQPEMRIPPAFMEDNNGAFCDEIHYEIRKTDSGTYLDLVIDTDWLSEPERAYPVVIDPRVEISRYSGNSLKLVEVCSDGTTVSATNTKISRKVGVDSCKNVHRLYVGFNLPELADGFKITKAGLLLHQKDYASYGKIHNYEINSIQLNGYTVGGTSFVWDNIKDLPIKNTIDIIRGYNRRSATEIEIDITKDMNDWYENPSTSRCIMIKKENEEPCCCDGTCCATYLDLYSLYASYSYRPKLYVEYTNKDMYADHQEYHTFENGRAGTGYVNLFNGNFLYEHSDIALQGAKLPLSVSHLYRPEFNDVKYGTGWKLSVEQTLEVINKHHIYAVYTDAQGKLHYFMEDSDGLIKDDAGLGLTFAHECECCCGCKTNYSISDEQGNKMLFNEDGKLVQITDVHKNISCFTYTNGNLTKVVDGNGNTATFIYRDNKLYQIIDADGDALTFSYKNGMLSTIKYPSSQDDNRMTTFDYTQGRLNKIIDISGITYSLDYDTKGRIANILCVGNISISNNEAQISDTSLYADRIMFDYRGSSTAVINNRTKLKTVYKFDVNGRVLSTYLDSTELSDSSLKSETTVTEIFDYESIMNVDETSKMGKYRSLSVSLNNDADNEKNLLKNGLFDNATGTLTPTDWYVAGSIRGASGVSTENYLNGKKSYYFGENNANTEKYLSQTVCLCNCELNGNILVASAWAKAVGNVTAESENSTARFRLCLKVIYEDGEVEEYFENYDTSYTGWQYAAIPFVLNKECCPIQVTVKLDYSSNKGTCYFTNASLVSVDGNITINTYRKNDGYVTTVCVFDEGQDIKLISKQENNLVTTSAYQNSDSDVVYSVITDIDGQKFENFFKYDNNHNLVKSQDYRGVITEMTYNSYGKELTRKTYHKNSPNEYMYSEYTYDNSQFLKSERDPRYSYDGSELVKRYSYDNVRGLLQQETDLNGQTYHHAYDSKTDEMKRLTSADDSSTIQNDFSYKKGYLTQIGHNGFTYGFDFNALGRTSLISIAGTPLFEKTYEETNTSESVFTAYNTGEETVVTNDIFGNPIRWSYKGKNEEIHSDIYSAEYDHAGRLKKYIDNEGGICYNFTYNEHGQVIAIKEYDLNGLLLRINTFAYDSKERLASIAYGAVGQTYRPIYDKNANGYEYPDNVVVGIKLDGKFTDQTEKDGFGRASKRTLTVENTPLFTENYSYLKTTFSSGKTIETSVVAQTSAQLGATSENTAYTYDISGNIETVTVDSVLVARYSYDKWNRIVREDNHKFGKTYIWEYDTGGNITEKRTYPLCTGDNVSGEYTSDTYEYATSGWKDQLTSFNGEVCTYDVLGNPTTYRGKELTWTNIRRLAKFGDVEFTYNADGSRTSKTANGAIHSYVLDGDKILRENTGSNSITYYYGYDGIIGFDYNGSDYFYHKNIQGDVIAIYTSSGAKVASYEYDAWGNHKILDANGNEVTATTHIGYINPVRYRGYYYDVETGLYYVSSRYYDPEIGRFINADDIDYLGADGSPLSYNLFAYCMNNPVNRFDVNGNWSLPNWAKVAIGAVATVAAVAVTVATGGAAAPVLIGVAASTIGGAAVSAVNHRVTTGSWEGAGKAALDGAADGFMTGGLCALGGSVVGGAARTIKNAKSGITIGKVGTFEDVAALAKTRHYSGLKEFNFIKKVAGQKAAETVGWWQNKCVVKGVMALKGAIYDCGGALTGAYAKEVALTKGYQYLYNVWLM